jgi:hypothetical protein
VQFDPAFGLATQKTLVKTNKATFAAMESNKVNASALNLNLARVMLFFGERYAVLTSRVNIAATLLVPDRVV